MNRFVNNSCIVLLTLLGMLQGIAAWSQTPERFYLNGKAGFKKNGVVIIQATYDAAGDFSEGLAIVVQNNKRGYIDESGKMVITCMYEDAGSFSGGLAPVKHNGLYGYITKSGATKISFSFEEAYSFSCGLARVKQNGVYRFTDSNGNFLKDNFAAANNFSENLAAVKSNGKWGFIDTTGKTVLAFQYDAAGYFSGGKVRVVKGDDDVMINTAGKILSRNEKNIEERERELQRKKKH